MYIPVDTHTHILMIPYAHIYTYIHIYIKVWLRLPIAGP